MRMHAPRTMSLLLAEEDTDGDRKITVNDTLLRSGARGDGRFVFADHEGAKYCLSGIYHLSNLLQELAWSVERGDSVAVIHSSFIFENPAGRISRLIRERYWDNLTRRVDVAHLAEVLPDDKMPPSDRFYLYYPANDAVAREHFATRIPAIDGRVVHVVELPPRSEITPQFVASFKGRHGLLTLGLRRKSGGGELEGIPYVVPGGRFNEMYGWDSYFEALALIRDGRCDLAKAMVENFAYEIEHFGKILNGNRSYYLTRSQPPFLTSMALAVHDACDVDAAWLERAIRAAIAEYHAVWLGPGRMTWTGLSRYHGDGSGKPPEVEEGHFDEIYRPFAEERGMDLDRFAREYSAGLIDEPALDRFHEHDRAMRESGHDRSYRWFVGGAGAGRMADRDRCADFVTVDLNCLLYKYEIDIARAIRDRFGGRLDVAGSETRTSDDWYELASRRRGAIMRYLYDEGSGLFFDFNYVDSVQSDYLAATVFYPLWACHADDPSTRILDEEQAAKLIAAVLNPDMLEQAGGLSASSPRSLESIAGRSGKDIRQWDYPYGWAPHQMIAWQGLKNYGDRFGGDADRLIYKWLFMITANARDHNGTIPEKFDVVRSTHDVFAEYGNVGTRFDYITKEGFGWMNASYQVGLSMLPAAYVRELELLTAPDLLFER